MPDPQISTPKHKSTKSVVDDISVSSSSSSSGTDSLSEVDIQPAIPLKKTQQCKNAKQQHKSSTKQQVLNHCGDQSITTSFSNLSIKPAPKMNMAVPAGMIGPLVYKHDGPILPGLSIYSESRIPALKAGLHFKGYFIMAAFDEHFENLDSNFEWCNARIWTNDSVLVTIPAMTFEEYQLAPQFVDEGVILSDTIDNIKDFASKVDEQGGKTVNVLIKFQAPSDAPPSGIQLDTEVIFDNNVLDKKGEWDMTTLKGILFQVNNKTFNGWYVACTDVSSKNIAGPPGAGAPLSKVAIAKAEHEERI